MKIFYLYLFSICFLIGCNTVSEEEETKKLSEVKTINYTINELPYFERPYIREHVLSLNLEHFDADSIPVYIYQGEAFYHPVFVSMYGINYVDGAVRTDNPRYLQQAEKIAAKLVEKANEKNDHFLFPYNFDFEYGKDKLKAPWYSGMAQGRLLSLFSRLYQVTQKPIYLQWAENTFESFKLIKNQREEEWVGYIDLENYYWIEEYPADNPSHVLNGFIFAIYGLYDYYITTHNPESLKLLNAAITTVEHYIGQYRNPGNISFYDLKNKFLNENYHPIHIDQLNMLSKITGESYFKEMADLFGNDYLVE